jgi:antitoxin ParD1/3/4
VNAGEYQNASEIMRDALRALQQRRRPDDLKLALLRAQIELGVSALERGDATEIDEGEIESYLAELGAPRARRSPAQSPAEPCDISSPAARRRRPRPTPRRS